jgi:transposase
VLGASSFIYAEATASQALADWIGGHVNALTALGGVPRQIVSDNLKAGITKACFYEPTVNRTYADMAAHYRTAIIPARPYKPTKPKSRWACRWCSAGSWHGCAIGGSSRWVS